MISYTTAIKQSRAQALVTLIDAHATLPGCLKLYSGAKPASAGLDPEGTALVTVLLRHPCSSSVADGVVHLVDTEECLVDATGITVWARLVSGDGTVLGDMDVGPTGSGADIEIPSLGQDGSVQLIQGSFLRLVGATITEG